MTLGDGELGEWVTVQGVPRQFENPVPLGSGGFGTVWSAMAPGGVPVALKLPNRSDTDSLDRFAREVKLQSTLEHANITEILDFDLAAEPPWCALPLAHDNFESYIASAAVPIEWIFDLLRQTAAGVAYAHEKHVLHRDLKPTNVLVYVGRDGPCARVADFGLSRRFTREKMTYQTATGHAFFTRGYSAPEQYLEFSAVTVTADVFSLGRIIEFCLSVRPDFGEAYPGLTQCARVATRENPDERYQSVDHLIHAMESSATVPDLLLRPIDQVRTAATRALANPDETSALADLMLVLERHGDNYPVLQGMFSKLPYELLDRVVERFPGQMRAVLRGYVRSLTEPLPVDSAIRARNLLDRCLVETGDPALRGIALTGLVLLAATYDMPEFNDTAVGWLHSESDPDVVGEALHHLETRREVRLWMRANVDRARVSPTLGEWMSRG